MKLSQLIKHIKYVSHKGDLDIEITSLSQDAKRCNKDCLLFCYKGVKFDTHDFVEQIKQTNFACLVVERYIDIDVPQILVKNTRNVMPKICNTFFGNVLKKLKFVGVTGTNGKTTTTSIIYQMLSNAGHKVALVGTNGIKYDGKSFCSSLTTPDTIDLFYHFADMAKCKVEYVVMEVSAHALDLNKVKGIKFDVSIFTNLTQDHLDYFNNMGSYARCKLKLFQKNYSKYAIINTDDNYGRLFSRVISIPHTTYGIDDVADNFAIDINMSLSSTTFVANVLDNIFDIKTHLLCKFNVYNILASMICAIHLGVDNDVIYKTLLTLDHVDGRMNKYVLTNGAVAIIDYAHTPDGLEQVLTSLRNITNGRIITIFGCGGDRDRLKRPKMARVVSTYSDYSVVTSDNPRNEDISKIISNILDGMVGNRYVVEQDRKKAIAKGFELSNKGDVILIAGKGVENYIDIKGQKIPYSDYDSIKSFLK